jgi:hypothetical protein
MATAAVAAGCLSTNHSVARRAYCASTAWQYLLPLPVYGQCSVDMPAATKSCGRLQQLITAAEARQVCPRQDIAGCSADTRVQCVPACTAQLVEPPQVFYLLYLSPNALSILQTIVVLVTLVALCFPVCCEADRLVIPWLLTRQALHAAPQRSIAIPCTLAAALAITCYSKPRGTRNAGGSASWVLYRICACCTLGAAASSCCAHDRA